MQELIQTIKVLDEDQLKDVNDYIDTLEFNPAMLPKTDGSSGIDISNRSGLQLYLEEGIGTKLLHSCMNNALLEYRKTIAEVHENFNNYPLGYPLQREMLSVLEYSEGDQYNYHHDQAIFPDKNEYYRKISLVLYLKKAEEGGGTSFPHKTFRPEAGYGLFFPSNWCYPHSGEQVIEGRKRVVVTWYYVNLT